MLDFPVQGRREPSGARGASLKVTQVPGALFWGETPGRSLHARPASVRRGLAARYGSYLGVDGYGGAFAEAPGHRIGKAMAAEPSPTTVVGVFFYVLAWIGLELLDTARAIADFDLPMRMLGLWWGNP